jgi:hypothetical protein
MLFEVPKSAAFFPSRRALSSCFTTNLQAYQNDDMVLRSNPIPSFHSLSEICSEAGNVPPSPADFEALPRNVAVKHCQFQGGRSNFPTIRVRGGKDRLISYPFLIPSIIVSSTTLLHLSMHKYIAMQTNCLRENG